MSLYRYVFVILLILVCVLAMDLNHHFQFNSTFNVSYVDLTNIYRQKAIQSIVDLFRKIERVFRIKV